jgi:hypothetical protein
MRIETLSDHPGVMLADAVGEQQRGTAGQEAVLNEALRARDQALTERRWLRWLRLTFTVRREKRELAGQRRFSQQSTGRVESIRAGRNAEQVVAEKLSRALDDNWTLFGGYRNRRGEIDGLLLGPTGLFAYEVKYYNATIFITGDDWQLEKFDKYGNQVSDRTPMGDKRGRSPSVQLNQPVAALTDWLGKRGQPVAITPVVLLTHERARVGSSRNPTVRVETSVQGLLSLTGQSPAALSTRQRADIGQLIRDDHHHHNQRRPTSRPGRL